MSPPELFWKVVMEDEWATTLLRRPYALAPSPEEMLVQGKHAPGTRQQLWSLA